MGWVTGLRGMTFWEKAQLLGEKIEENPKILALQAPEFLKIGTFSGGASETNFQEGLGLSCNIPVENILTESYAL